VTEIGPSINQLIKIEYLKSFCDMTLADRRKQLQKIDDHSPNFARMNVVYGNFPEFAKAFKCKKGKKMTNPDNKCEVW
jgi:predicted metalloendopeptidase